MLKLGNERIFSLKSYKKLVFNRILCVKATKRAFLVGHKLGNERNYLILA